jgi:hypothetical protein
MRLTLAKQIEVGPIEDVNKATHDPSVAELVLWVGEEPHLAAQHRRCFRPPRRLAGRRVATVVMSFVTPTLVADWKIYLGKPDVPRFDLFGLERLRKASRIGTTL